MNKKNNVPNEERDQSKFFYSYDLGCSAALLCVGFELLSLDKGNQRKVQFIFRRTKAIENAARQYFSDRLEVKARRYFDNIKALKNSIYSE